MRVLAAAAILFVLGTGRAVRAETPQCQCRSIRAKERPAPVRPTA
jgi:hypothetical protein